jgi:large subunit ribosomal protein LP0
MPEEEGRTYSEKKQNFAERLENLVKNNKNVLIINADNVGSQQMHQVRADLRKGPKAEILMGKNTMIKFVLRRYANTSGDSSYNKLADLCKLNVGLVFTNDLMSEVRDVLERNKVVAAAKAGAVAQCDVSLPAGPTGLEPTQTSFFQALGIATKINKGAIEIISPVQLCTKGEKVGPSESVLLGKMGLKPFAYGLVVEKVFTEGAVLSPAVLNIKNEDVCELFQKACQNVAAVGLAIGYPVAPAIPHMVINAFKNLLSVAIVTDINFPAAEKMKDIINNPEKYASAAPAAGAAAPAAGGAAPAAGGKKAPEPEPEEEEMAFDLFD